MTRAAVSIRHPRAHAICDRCGTRYNHDELRWQFQWQGPTLQNLRILVCKTCEDIPQEQLRTIILPPDPVPIENPRPEAYVEDNNPNSPIGQSASPLLPGTNIGTLIGGGGTYAAFDGRVGKPASLSAYLPVSGSSFAWVGKDWNAHLAGATEVSTSDGELQYVAIGFTATSPSNMAFLSGTTTTYAFQGSSDAVTWTTLASTTTAGGVAEEITVTGLGGAYRYHRFALLGDGVNAVGVAQLQIDTDRGVLS